MPLMDAYDRFQAKVGHTNENGCQEWTASRNPQGYGKFCVNKKDIRAHVYALLITLGLEELPEGRWVCHTCDNPPCVNVNHLYLGTPLSNNQDMVFRGRAVRVTGDAVANKGSVNGRAKLTEEQVKEIRLKYSAGGVTYKSLAKEYSVSYGLIGFIIQRRNWRHV